MIDIPILVLALPLAFALAAGLAVASRFARVDFTPLEHAAIAAGAQSLWAALTGDWWAGAAIGTAIFLGREHAQAEARMQRAGLARGDFWDVLRAFRREHWNTGSALDLIAPTVVTIIIAGVAHALR